MKRTLLSAAVLLAVFTLFFTACQDPVNPSSITTTTEDTFSEVSGPEWVRATAYPGAIQVAWAFNKDAKSYSVYRQRSDGQDNLRLLGGYNTTGSTPAGYLDVVSADNQLADGVEYIYYVTSNSGQGIVGRAVVNPEGVPIIKDGASSTTVTARIPDRYKEGVWEDVSALLEEGQSFTDEPGATDRFLNKEIYDDWKLLLSWKHYNPGFKYDVSYDLGVGANLPESVSWNQSISPEILPNDTKSTYAFYGVPILGGENRVRITITLGGNMEYYKPVTITVPLSTVTTGLAKPTVFNVSRGATNATTAKVNWTRGTDLAFTDYQLYRIKTVDNTYVASITVEGDWERVPLSAANVSLNGMAVELQDTGLAADKGYLYALFAVKGNARSPAVTAQVPAHTLPVGDLAFDVQAAVIGGQYRAVIGWNGRPGQTYELTRAEVTAYPETKTGDFGPIPGIGTPTADSSGRYTVVDAPAIRKSYKYRLAVRANGLTEYKVVNLNQGVFRDYVESDIHVNNDSRMGDFDSAYATRVDITGGDANVSDLMVDIYRAVVPSNLEGQVRDGEYTDFAIGATAFTLIKTLPFTDNVSHIDTGLVIGTHYVYRHVVRTTTGTVLSNTATAGKTGRVQSPSKPFIQASWAPDVKTGIAGNRWYYRVQGSYLEGAVVRFQTAPLNSPNDWSDAVSLPYFALTPVTKNTSGRNIIDAGTNTETNIANGEYYFIVSGPTLMPSGANYRIVLVNKEGNLTEDNPAWWGRLDW
jgi:hypothetical protein